MIKIDKGNGMICYGIKYVLRHIKKIQEKTTLEIISVQTCKSPEQGSN